MGPGNRQSSNKLPHQARKSSRTGTRNIFHPNQALSQGPARGAPFEILIRLFGDFSFIIGNGGIIRGATFYQGEIKYHPAELVGRHLAEFLGPIQYDSLDQLLHKAQSSGLNQTYEYSFKTPNGLRWLRARMSPLPQSKSIVLLLRDTTSQRHIEHARKNARFLVQAGELARVGSFEIDLRNNTLTCSLQLYRNLDIDPSEPLTREAFMALVHPEDRERVQTELKYAIAHHQIVDSEFRCVTSSGRVKTFHRRALPIYENGVPIAVVGMSQDVTQQRAEEQRLRRSEALLAHAETIVNIGSWEYEISTGHTILSNQLLRMYGLESPNDWNVESFWKSLAAPDVDAIRTDVKRAIDACQPFEFTVPFRMPDGKSRVYRVVGETLAAVNGAPEKVLGIVHDVTDHVRIEQDLHRLSRELIRARDSERRQLARGLHETAGQTLAALKMTLGNLAELLPEDSAAAREHIKDARAFAEDAVREVRLVSYLMYPPLLDDAGLGPALVRARFFRA